MHQAVGMTTLLQQLLHLSTVENGEKYNAVMTRVPQDAEPSFSMLEHVPSAQTQSSAAPVLPFLMPYSQGSRHISRNQSLVFAELK